MYRRSSLQIEALVQQEPENRSYLRQQSCPLSNLGDVRLSQGQYAQAKTAHEQALQIDEQLGNLRDQAVSRGQLGTIALQQGNYAEARTRHQQALNTFHTQGESATAIREALEQGDQEALQQAFTVLSAQEQQTVMEIFADLQAQQEGGDEEQDTEPI